MSEPIPESIPTSADPRSKRPVKKRALTPVSAQSAQITALFKHPDRPVELPKQKTPKTLAPPPEIVANVQGSSAGAGSGEFHVYKASRRREYERLRMMDEEVAKEKSDEDWMKQREENLKKDQEKTGKNRKRREKAKARKEKAKREESQEPPDAGEGTGGEVKKLRRMAAHKQGTKISEDNEANPTEEKVKNTEEIGIVIHDEG